MPEFLSDDWVDAVKAVRDRYADQAPPVPFKIKMNQVITDVPFGDGERRMHVDTSDGQMVMELGELPDAEVTITTDYTTARQLFVDQDQQAAMQAFMAGKIKVQGDMTKLMMMQASPPGEIARQIAQEIKDLTT